MWPCQNCKHSAVLISLGLGVFTGLISFGCSLIGLTVGLSQDAGSHDTVVLKPSAADDLERGAAIQVLLKNSSLVDGQFVGMDAHPDTSFARLYQSWRAHGDRQKMFPAIGDTVKINQAGSDNSGVTRIGIFLGFDVGVMCLQSKGGVQRIPLSTVSSIFSGDGKYVGDPFKLMNTQDSLSPPLRSNLMIRCERDTLRLPLGDVLRIYTSTVTHDAITYTLMGATVDALVIWLIYEAHKAGL